MFIKKWLGLNLRALTVCLLDYQVQMQRENSSYLNKTL